jgi:putative oxidoreductase
MFRDIDDRIALKLSKVTTWSSGGVLEVFGGALLLFGLFTRPVAFVLSGMLAVAYWQFHAPTGFWPTMNGGVPAALYCFVLLYISAAGAGPWSLDAMRGKKLGDKD